MLSERVRSYVSLAVIIGLVYGGVQLLQGRHNSQQAEVLRTAAKPGDIVMLSSQTCSYCERAREWMSKQQVPFKECMIETDAACLAEFQARGGLGTPTMVVRGRTVVGFDPARVAEILSPPRAAAPG